MRTLIFMLGGLLAASPAWPAWPAVEATAASANVNVNANADADAVTLHLFAQGRVLTKADVVTIFVPITSRAPQASDARTANRATIDRLTAALVQHGVPRDSIVLIPPGAAMIGFIGNERYGDFEEGAPLSATPQDQRPGRTASATLKITLHDPAGVAAVQAGLDAENQAMNGAPQYGLQDDQASRTAAIADALRRAKSDAAAYAAPLGLRVARVTRVSNVGETAFSDPDIMLEQMLQRQSEGSLVITGASIWVDFVLVPR